MTGESSEKLIKHNLDAIEATKLKKLQIKFWEDKGYDELQKGMIQTIRASVRRNIKNYPLGPGLNKQ
jgi:hypothetical protein